MWFSTVYVNIWFPLKWIIFCEHQRSAWVSLKTVSVYLSQVAGIKGMFLANKKTDNQVKTYITYNRGRDWRLLQAPGRDLRGSSIHCVLVSAPAASSIFLSMCLRDRSRLIPAQREPRSESSSRQSWVLRGGWAERSAVLIQSNKPTSHLSYWRKKKKCQTEKRAPLLHLSVFLRAPESWASSSFAWDFSQMLRFNNPTKQSGSSGTFPTHPNLRLEIITFSPPKKKKKTQTN